MDFNGAIKAHTQWKMKLSAYLRRPDGSLKPADIEPDNRCPLGQWIHGDGAIHAVLPEYSTLKSAHSRFHTAAAAVVRKADAGESVTEEVAIGSTSAFGSASTEVMTALLKMERVHNQKQEHAQ